MPQNVIEKVWHKSKKFLAFLIMEAVLSGLAFYTVYSLGTFGWPVVSFLTAVVLNMGFIAVAFNAKQAELDKYVRFVALTGKAPGAPLVEGKEDV
jgi:hypothetical protein